MKEEISAIGGSASGGKNYEIGFLAKSEEGKEWLVKTLKDRHFSIADGGDFSRIKLAYPIKKESFAYFGYLYFSGKPENIKELKNELNPSPKILRFIIISEPVMMEENKKQEERQIISEKSSFESPAPTPAISQPLKEKPEKPKTGTLSNEELEKKLEEILK